MNEVIIESVYVSKCNSLSYLWACFEIFFFHGTIKVDWYIWHRTYWHITVFNQYIYLTVSKSGQASSTFFNIYLNK